MRRSTDKRVKTEWRVFTTLSLDISMRTWVLCGEIFSNRLSRDVCWLSSSRIRNIKITWENCCGTSPWLSISSFWSFFFPASYRFCNKPHETSGKMRKVTVCEGRELMMMGKQLHVRFLSRMLIWWFDVTSFEHRKSWH